MAPASCLRSSIDRVVRLLVEELGFRCVALEEDWTKGLQLDQYLATGTRDPRALLGDAGPPWRTAEILRLLTWMRAYNQAHPDDRVHLLGVDVVAVGRLAYEAVTRYVQQAAPDRAGELEQQLAPTRPTGGVHRHLGWLHRQPDTQPLLEHARRAYGLVASLPASGDQALALQHAKVIVGFYAYHARQWVAVRDQQMAENLRWWQQRTGQRVVYWAANVHTASDPRLAISYPPFPPARGRTAGARLREWYGRGYRSVG
jgi:erythromycin esterase